MQQATQIINVKLHLRSSKTTTEIQQAVHDKAPPCQSRRSMHCHFENIPQYPSEVAEQLESHASTEIPTKPPLSPDLSHQLFAAQIAREIASKNEKQTNINSYNLQ
jgi:hypothetical protein